MATKLETNFKDYPASQQVFETKDGWLFHQEGDANLHQYGSLKSKEAVKKHVRPLRQAQGETSLQEQDGTGEDDAKDVVIGEDVPVAKAKKK